MKMKTTITIALTALFSVSAFASTHATMDMHSLSNQVSTQYPDIAWTTVDKIASELPEQPIVVGLDIDDTMLFSSPVFYYGKQKYSPDSFDYLKNQDFWNEASTGLDRFSIPKKSAVELVTMHLKHGDTVYFITGRTAPQGQETLTTTLRNIFPKQYKEQIKPVVFAGSLDKVQQLKMAKISQYYGDSDKDITSSREAGVKAIRFLRGAQTTYTPLPHAGKYGEEVLINSNY
ncbi:acid phosphatase AphA [Vibrio artabrorum]|uniref:Class B acid phosphatase n=1 Tax=Vibrio artabrorum TaxID=446374 RepID=A0ABT8CPT6_9VIBR|nr:acid phosphatase AphA [Vibrio artabrorum]MDN3702464.1 acid phosphatase AphA [Vibrio artabrorum]